tara:strand:+ start:61 stop:249 length:189 start_codon:yes stop_codon:yes gene_type:complete
MDFIKSLASVLKGFVVFYLAIVFVTWYVKMHKHPKWWWAFWLNTICAIYIQVTYDGPEGWPK